MRSTKSHLTSFDVINKFKTTSKQEVILKSEVQKSEASENELNKILRYGRFGNNVERDQHKIADVTNNQK